MTFELYNTLTRRREPFIPGDPARVTFYSCGPTVYDDAHIGNFRSFLAADVLRRWIESPLCTLASPTGDKHQGPRTVVHVMNITDVGHMTDDAAADGEGEDKMQAASKRLLEAKKAGKLPQDAGDIDPSDQYAIASFYTRRFLDDAKKLGLKVATEAEQDPTLMPRPTAMVPEMIGLIASLIEKHAAYAVPATCPVTNRTGHTVYFSVESFPAYGQLSGNTLEHLRSGAGGRVTEHTQQEKKHPADFLLWKFDPTHAMRWDSPWGEGYPGWHLECSAMARARLGEVIDLHSGGEDNIFPHHECERAQSCAASGKQLFSRHWFHPRFLVVEGEKMSKSKGNFYSPRQLFAQGVEPAALRLELIKTHYRANANFTDQGLVDSGRIVERWRRFIEQAASGNKPKSTDDHPRSAEATEVIERFREAMHDDLNIAGAIGAINAWIGRVSAPTPADAQVMRLFDVVLGVVSLGKLASAQTSIGVFIGGLQPDPAVVELLQQRADARKNKDFATSDRIRDELLAKGLAIKDIAGGKVEVSPAR